MNNTLTKHILLQLDSIAETYKNLRKRSPSNASSDMGAAGVHGLIARSRAAIERASGRDSAYSRQVRDILARRAYDLDKLGMIVGVVESLATDIRNGYLSAASELIRSEVFGEFLEMADHLSDEGYKDAAAVIGGSALEAQLRQLCDKSGIATGNETPKGIRVKRADSMNSDLGNASAISKLDQKNVTAWLDLRNKAAHGKYAEYSGEQVALMIAGIRDFITRNPA